MRFLCVGGLFRLEQSRGRFLVGILKRGQRGFDLGELLGDERVVDALLFQLGNCSVVGRLEFFEGGHNLFDGGFIRHDNLLMIL